MFGGPEECSCSRRAIGKFASSCTRYYSYGSQVAYYFFQCYFLLAVFTSDRRRSSRCTTSDGEKLPHWPRVRAVGAEREAGGLGGRGGVTSGSNRG